MVGADTAVLRGILKAKGRYDEAILDYTALMKSPGSEEIVVDILTNRAYCHGKMCVYDLAIKDYAEVIAICPKNAHALFNRAICLQKTGAYSQV